MKSIVIATTHLVKTLLFYEILGFKFKKKEIAHGSEIYWAQIGNMEFAFIFKDKELELEKRKNNHYFFSFFVNNIEAKVKLLSQHGFISVMDLTIFSDCKKSIFLDPDERTIEFFEKI